MALRVRKAKVQKFFFPYETPGVFYFELKTIPNSERAKAASESYSVVSKQPLTQKARKRMMAAEEVEVTQKMRADLLSIREKELSLVSFVLPGEDGILESSKMDSAQIKETMDNLEEDLDWYLEQCIDVMQGNYPDADTWERLESFGITHQMMNLPEITGDVEDPTNSGEDA